jgi:hypothetical protein
MRRRKQRALAHTSSRALPTWPYSAGWGYFPSGGLALILIVFVLLILLDRRTLVR